MLDVNDLSELSPPAPIANASAQHVINGIPIPKPLRVRAFAADEWEEFVQEWATFLQPSYARVARSGGAGDQGIDVVGFINDHTFDGGWDLYQCKRYDHPLYPSDIWVEIGKIIYYSHRDDTPLPRYCYFIATQDVGTTLGRLLANPQQLKEEAMAKWADKCESEITSTKKVPLEGDLLEYFNTVDFSIFRTKSVVELLSEHDSTPYHTVRFGGGLPARPIPNKPPNEPEHIESRYIRQLFDAYGDNLEMTINDINDLSKEHRFRSDFSRQRERFYHAESLRNFARDSVPEGTFARLQTEVFHGIIETCEDDYDDGFQRMKATIERAALLPTATNPLASVVEIQDRQGICHQLANIDKIRWVPGG